MHWCKSISNLSHRGYLSAEWVAFFWYFKYNLLQCFCAFTLERGTISLLHMPEKSLFHHNPWKTSFCMTLDPPDSHSINEDITSSSTVVAGRMWRCERANKEASPSICLIKIISRQRDTQRGGGEYKTVFLYSCHCTANGTNHLWSCCRHTIWNLGHLYSSLCVRQSCHDCLYGWALASSSSTFVWRADGYMWYFALGVALRDHWPIYWHTQEAARCHGAKSRRRRRKDES